MTPKGAPSVGDGDMGTPRCPEPARPCPATQGATLASGYTHPQHPIPSVPLERWPPQPPAQPCCHPLGTRRTRGDLPGLVHDLGPRTDARGCPGAGSRAQRRAPRPLQVPTRLAACLPLGFVMRCLGLAGFSSPVPPSFSFPSPRWLAGTRQRCSTKGRIRSSPNAARELGKRPDPRRVALGTPSLNPQPRFPAAALPAGPHPAPCSRAGRFSGFS